MRRPSRLNPGHTTGGLGQASVLHRSRSVVRSGTSSRKRSRRDGPGSHIAYQVSGEGLVDVVHATRCQLVTFVGCPRTRWDLV
jgi:hypothetical protein